MFRGEGRDIKSAQQVSEVNLKQEQVQLFVP